MISNIAVFASGSGSNAQNIIEHFKGSAKFSFPVIISNKQDAFVHERARELGIPSYTFSKLDFETSDKVLDLLSLYNIDAIVLAGFLLKVPSKLIEQFPQRIINIHPALLPKFGGKGMYGDKVHEAVKEAGENESGITIHFINEHYDEGNIIFQASCAIYPHDTADTIAQKVHALEYEYHPQIIEQIWG